MPEGRRPSLGETYSEVAALVHAQEHLPDDEDNDASSISSSQWKGFIKEARLFLELAVPTCLLSFGTNISPFLTASVVGLKFGKTYLSAFTLANLTGNLCTFSMMWGLFSAADTLSPQAFGKGDYKEVGYQAMRGVVVAVSIVVPSNTILVIYLEDMLLFLGQDPEAAGHAMAWYRIFVCALPFCVIFTAAWKFMSAQHVMMPLIYVSVFSCVVVLPVALEIFTEAFGFLGSAMAYVTFQASQTILLLIYMFWKRPHVPETLPGLGKESWKIALQWGPLMEYLNLAAGGMFAQSEWIFWEALGLIIGKLGVLELSVHTIPTQVIMLLCLAPFAFGTALAIRMGITLSQKDDNAGAGNHSAGRSVRKTQKMVVYIISLSLVVFGLVTLWMYIKQHFVFSFFTTEPEVIALAEHIWWKVCLFSLNVAVFALLTGVATGLGMQWSLGFVNFGFLWLFGVPVTYYSTIILGGGLDAAWTWINVPYLMMNVTLLIIFLTTDWYKIQAKILSGDIIMDPEQTKPTGGVGTEALTTNETSGLLNGNGSHSNNNNASNGDAKV